MAASQPEKCVCTLLQVAALMRERDSLAQQNAALAATTGRLMGAGTNTDPGTPTSPVTLASVLDSQAGGSSMGSADGGLGRSAVQSAAARQLMVRAASTPGSLAVGGPEGTLLTPGQAREIGALLSRLTRENAAFMRSRDVAAGERDAALERVSALEVELELLQEQLRWVGAWAGFGSLLTPLALRVLSATARHMCWQVSHMLCHKCLLVSTTIGHEAAMCIRC
jgi:hypothetical protein